MCLDYANNMVYTENLRSFWDSGIWYMLGRECLRDQLPMKTLGAESVMGFIGQKYHIHGSAPS